MRQETCQAQAAWARWAQETHTSACATQVSTLELQEAPQGLRKEGTSETDVYEKTLPAVSARRVGATQEQEQRGCI